MGGTQSTRKITVENDTSIQVSKEAVDRIQAQINQEKPNPIPIQELHPVSFKPKITEMAYPILVGGENTVFPYSHVKDKNMVQELPISPEERLNLGYSTQMNNPIPPPLTIPGSDNVMRQSAPSTPTSQPVNAVPFSYPDYLESKRSSYAAEEAYWTKRIENLKRKHENINSGLKAEYQKTLKHATDLFETAQKEEVMKMPPCQDEVKKIMNCYKTNSGKTLACAGAVSSFMECVSKSKSKTVTA